MYVRMYVCLCMYIYIYNTYHPDYPWSSKYLENPPPASRIRAATRAFRSPSAAAAAPPAWKAQMLEGGDTVDNMIPA